MYTCLDLDGFDLVYIHIDIHIHVYFPDPSSFSPLPPTASCEVESIEFVVERGLKGLPPKWGGVFFSIQGEKRMAPLTQVITLWCTILGKYSFRILCSECFFNLFYFNVNFQAKTERMLLTSLPFWSCHSN